MHRTLRRYTLAILALLICTPFAAQAQIVTSSPNLFSPYTMYGLGEMVSPANLSSRLMGGVGVARINSFEINYLNPASLGSIRQRSALFNFAGEGQNHYSTATSYDISGNQYKSSTANNSFSLHDVAFAIPLARGVGFSIAMTPVSQVGYSSTLVDDSQDIVQNVGRAIYSYSGEGGISAVTASLGVKVAKGLSLGGSLIYYFGTIDRYYNADISQMIAPANYYSVRSFEKINISRILGSFGFQYYTRVNKTGHIAIGATYQMKASMNSDVVRDHMIVNSNVADTISTFSGKTNYVLPAKIAAGIAYQDAKIGVEFNYSWQDWKNAYDVQTDLTGVALAAQHDFRLGISYVPNRNDIRRALNRWTYKAGAHYGLNYLKVNGEQLTSYGVTIGADIPLKAGKFSKVSVGAEFGQQGLAPNALVKDTYFKLFIGLTFFGDDLWFEKRKFE